MEEGGDWRYRDILLSGGDMEARNGDWRSDRMGME